MSKNKCPECGKETELQYVCEQCGERIAVDSAALAEKVARAVIKHQMRMSPLGEAPTSQEILTPIIRRVIEEG